MHADPDDEQSVVANIMVSIQLRSVIAAFDVGAALAAHSLLQFLANACKAASRAAP